MSPGVWKMYRGRAQWQINRPHISSLAAGTRPDSLLLSRSAVFFGGTLPQGHFGKIADHLDFRAMLLVASILRIKQFQCSKLTSKKLPLHHALMKVYCPRQIIPITQRKPALQALQALLAPGSCPLAPHFAAPRHRVLQVRGLHVRRSLEEAHGSLAKQASKMMSYFFIFWSGGVLGVLGLWQPG